MASRFTRTAVPVLPYGASEEPVKFHRGWNLTPLKPCPRMYQMKFRAGLATIRKPFLVCPRSDSTADFRRLAPTVPQLLSLKHLTPAPSAGPIGARCHGAPTM